MAKEKAKGIQIVPRLAWGMQGVDYQERINFDRLRRERMEKTRAGMKRRGIAAVILTTINLRYATGTRTPEWRYRGSDLGIVFAEYDPIVYLSHEAVVHNRYMTPWIKSEDIRTIPLILPGSSKEQILAQGRRMAQMIYQDLKEKKIVKEKIGIEDMVPSIRGGLEEMGVRMEAVDDLMLDVRKIKTEDEINCLKMAGAIAEKGWIEMFTHVKPGMTDNELSALGTAAMIRSGAEGPFKVSVRSGPLTGPNYTGMLTDRIVQYGDLQLCDIWGNVFCGYRTCYYRTWKVGGKPTPKEKDWYKRCYEWTVRMCNAVKPGVTTADVAKAFPKASDWGLKNEDETSVNALGHGIGVGNHDLPIIHRSVSFKHPEVLEKGMVLALEPWYGENLYGGVRLENTGVITDKGFETFYTIPIDELLVPRSSMIFEPY